MKGKILLAKRRVGPLPLWIWIVILVGICLLALLLYSRLRIPPSEISDKAPAYQWRFDVIMQRIPFLLEGIGVTLGLALMAMVLGILFGLTSAILRIANVPPLAQIATAYVELFRTTPVLVQLYWVFFAMPILLNVRLSAFPAGVMTLSLNVGAFLSEIFRAGITSIELGQWRASYAIGLTRLQAYRYVILPQAITRMLPPIASNWVGLVKMTSLVSVIGVHEITYRATSIATFTFRTMEAFTILAILYLVVVYPQALFANWIHRRYSSDEMPH